MHIRHLFLYSIFFISCTARNSEREEVSCAITQQVQQDSIISSLYNMPLVDSSFVNLARLSDDFIFDLKYATSDNFLGEAVYDCGVCYLRYKVALSLIDANKNFMKKGYRLKLFDCYRPLRVQKEMWAKMPDARYLANPYTSSSYHNRGCAVDLTLTDMNGNELDMGTSFDYFSPASHFAYDGFPDTILQNRRLLREVLESTGFRGIRTEWWHFSKDKFPVADEDLCE